jgi:membrane-bound inhibitor of C-type lysozyme
MRPGFHLVLAVAAAATLGLSGCRDRSAPAPSPSAASLGPVNPDPGVTSYACADGQTVTAGYLDRETAVVSYGDHSFTLKLARSADGARYTGYGLQWWTRGDRATLTELKSGEETASGQGLECRSAAPAGDSTTRTGFVGPK